MNPNDHLDLDRSGLGYCKTTSQEILRTVFSFFPLCSNAYSCTILRAPLLVLFFIPMGEPFSAFPLATRTVSEAVTKQWMAGSNDPSTQNWCAIFCIEIPKERCLSCIYTEITNRRGREIWSLCRVQGVETGASQPVLLGICYDIVLTYHMPPDCMHCRCNSTPIMLSQLWWPSCHRGDLLSQAVCWNKDLKVASPVLQILYKHFKNVQILPGATSGNMRITQGWLFFRTVARCDSWLMTLSWKWWKPRKFFSLREPAVRDTVAQGQYR